MSFLAPLFLLAGLAVALPVLFHLIRRTTRQQTSFSSLMFLFPTPPRLTQRSRLEHILLLLLRVSVICLLALGFSRPFIRKPMNPSPEGPGKRIVVLVDTSASMRRADLWTDARNKVQSVVRQATPSDQVALFTFDRAMNALVSFEQWSATAPAERPDMAMRSLAAVSPAWAGTRLDSALLKASELLADTRTKQNPGPGEIVVISDLQEGSHVELLQGAEWPRNVQVSVETLKPRHFNNASLQIITDSETSDSKAAPEVRVRVNNASDSRRDQFRMGWARADGSGFEGNPSEIYVPPGQSRVVSLAAPAAGSSLTRVMVQGDEEDFDNSLFVVPSEATRLKVLYIGNESELDPKNPLFFLKRAFQETRREVVEVRARKPEEPISATDLQAAQLLVVHDSVPANLAAVLRQAAAEGKTVLLMARSQAAAQPLAGLLGVSQLAVTDVKPANYAMLSEVDLRDPLFAVFADPRFSDFTRIHFWKYRRVDLAAVPEARVVARFDDGDPALWEVPLQKGRILVLGSSWAPEDSELALSTKFVPLLYSMLETSGAPIAATRAYLVGDVVPIAADPSAAELKVVGPDRSEVTLSRGETNFSGTLLPGIYTVARAQRQERFAVNIDPAESRTAPMSADELARLGVPLKRPGPPTWVAAAKQVRLQNAELESRQKLWRWMLAGALLVLLLETWLAGRVHRGAMVPISPPISGGPEAGVPNPASLAVTR